MAKRQSGTPEQLQRLRRRAEALLRAKPVDIPSMPIADVQALVHELSVHQVELEIQNEELRQAQVELADSRDRFSDLYDFAPVGYVTLDHRGNVRQANLTATKMLRTNRQQLLARPLSQFMTTAAADLLYLHLLRVFDNECKNVCELRLYGQDELPYDVRLESARVENQEPPECRTVISDITELAQIQEAAQNSQRLAALGTLAAGIAHEINNPLWMISLQADVGLAAKENPDRDRIVTQCFREIKQLVERGGRVVTSVLRFSKHDTTEKWPHSLASVLARSRDFTREHAANQQVSVHLEIPEHIPDVTLNPTEIEQVFVNLLTNAVHASQAGGHVRVAASCGAELVQVRVEDEGCGIPSEDVHRVFEPFYTTRRHNGGTGLGLNVAHRIIEDHHGTIELTSRPNRGTTVTVGLPITELHQTKDKPHGNHLGR